MSTRGNSRGQASVEYILMLSIIALMAIGVKRAFQPAIDRLADSITGRIDEMWSKGSLHNLRLGR